MNSYMGIRHTLTIDKKNHAEIKKMILKHNFRSANDLIGFALKQLKLKYKLMGRK